VDPIQIAVAQLAITVAEPDANRRAAADAVAEAAAAGARLVVLPELCDSGYVFDAADPAAEARALAAPAADSITLRQWHELAARHRLVIVGGFCELCADGRLYNSAALVDASGTRAVYRKAHLWDSEKLVFTPGDAPLPTVDTEVGRVAVMVCYDLEFPEWTRLAALDGAELIAAPVNWPGYSWPEGERPAEVVKAQAAAAANGVFVAVADRCRTERGVSWISGSLIASPEGYTLAGPVLADRPVVLTAACDLARARDKRVSGRNDLLADRRPELYARPHTRVAPIFGVSDLAAALAYYRGLGFGARQWRGGGYGFVTFDGVEIHLGVDPDLEKRADRRSTAYLFVEDADALARAWLAAGGDVRLPQDTEWGQHEGVLIDPDGNMIRFGSPVKAD
jgi:predicted amidohydrolase/predicted enzyme related to lactoylglutathione lyase